MADPLTEEQQQKRRKAVELMPQTPFMGALGIVFERYEGSSTLVGQSA
jgi:hypothetical protein